MKRCVLAMCLLAGVVLPAGQACAADKWFQWMSGAEPLWEDGLNWSSAGVPGASDTVHIESGDTPIVTQPEAQCSNLYAQNGGQLTIRGNSSLSVTQYLHIGDWNTGSLKIEDGGHVSSLESHLGDLGGSTGTAVVDGAGSVWSSDILYVGYYYGRGEMRIVNGGVVESAHAGVGGGPSATGSVTVDGTGSTWTVRAKTVGGMQYAGNLWITGGSNLNITNGGSVLSSMSYVSGNTGAKGTVTVDGQGSKWEVGSYDNAGNFSGTALNVGSGGQGELFVTNGGCVLCSGGWIGMSSGNGYAKVDGAGSEWYSQYQCIGTDGVGKMELTNGGSLRTGYLHLGRFAGSNGTMAVDGTETRCRVVATTTHGETGTTMVADAGTGRLDITNGASLTNTDAYVGDQATGVGTVTVSGSGSRWESTSVDVGRFGKGSVTITNGGTMQAGTRMRVYSSGDSVTVDGGTLQSQQIETGTSSMVYLKAGKIAANSFANSGTFTFTGGELHVDTFNGSLGVSGGKMCVGNATHTTSVSGSLTITSGSTSIGLGGTAAGQFDVIQVKSYGVLGGTLDVGLRDGFLPGYNQRFKVIDITGSASGRFAGLAQNGLVGTFGGVRLFIDYSGGTGNDVVLYTAPEPATLLMLGLGGIVLRRRVRRV
jgi:T5SS/PEP-CTERM-associated repeat protein